MNNPFQLFCNYTLINFCSSSYTLREFLLNIQKYYKAQTWKIQVLFSVNFISLEVELKSRKFEKISNIRVKGTKNILSQYKANDYEVYWLCFFNVKRFFFLLKETRSNSLRLGLTDFRILMIFCELKENHPLSS